MTTLPTPSTPHVDPGRVQSGGLAEAARAFLAAVRLGWATEANWTDPFLFFVYSVAKPVSAALILVVMIEIVGGASGRELRPYVVAGSALWSFVVAGIAGLAWSVLDDRERYRMLRYLYVSPPSFVLLLVGRGTARLAVGAMGAAITLGIGVVLLGVPVDPARIDWPLLGVAMVGGLAVIVVLGILLAAVCLQTRQDSWSYPEAVAGSLFLVSGAVFPLAVLPPPIQLVGLATPLTWWLAGVRLALFPDGPTAVGGPNSAWSVLAGTPAPAGPEIIAALLMTGALATLAAAVVFRWSEHRARERGLIDQTSGS
jgi:ABC-2 type transport system permease protein